MVVATAVLVCGLCAHFLAMTGPMPRWRAVVAVPEAPQASVEGAADDAEAGEMAANEDLDLVRVGIATRVVGRQCGRLRSPTVCYATD